MNKIHLDMALRLSCRRRSPRGLTVFNQIMSNLLKTISKLLRFTYLPNIANC